jgi:GNAT superfamily N-acetyltransferase
VTTLRRDGGVPPGITIEAATAAALRDDAGFWQLYATSFATAEREPAEVILRSIEQGPGFTLRALADGHTVGLATGHVLEEPAATFLVYLAVDPTWRSRHLGRALFEAADRCGAARLTERGRVTSGIAWEIDDPAADVSLSERNVRQRRLRFFDRLGGRLLETPYFQPPVDGHTLVPMRLMFRSAAGQHLPTGAAIEKLIRAIYFEKYCAINQIPSSTLERLVARTMRHDVQRRARRAR